MKTSQRQPQEELLDYSIRAITASDIPSYQNLRLSGLKEVPEAFGETAEHFMSVSAEQILTRLNTSETNGGFILGAFHSNGELVGVVRLAREEGEKVKHRAKIWGMYVCKSARRKGLGKLLMEECLHRANQVEGLEQVHLAVIVTNIAAVKLYESMGFKTYGQDPNGLKIGESRFDEYLMAKFLVRPE